MEDIKIWNETRSGLDSKRNSDPRSPEDHDLARVIHSGSFRRLQSKTQVLGLGESDFYRTRLTHSVEVAQIATGIKRYLEVNTKSEEYLQVLPGIPRATAISLAHDIGHPPFGHGGEVALNYMMRGRGGFEGNAQTLRILCHLEKKTKDFGLDLTRRTLLGVLKYPAAFSSVATEYQCKPREDHETTSFRSVDSNSWKPPKCYFDEDEDLVDWILAPLQPGERRRFQESADPKKKGKPRQPKYKSFDASLMDVSDDISYAVHDLEDAIHMHFISETCQNRDEIAAIFKDFDKKWLTKWRLNNVVNELFGEKWERKEAITNLVNCLVCSTFISKRNCFLEPLLDLKVDVTNEADTLINRLQSIVERKVIFSPEVQTLEYSGQLLVMELFEAMESAPHRLLPRDTQRFLEDDQLSVRPLERLICDHISGMTDDYAAKMHGRLFSPKTGSIFEKM